MDTGNNPVSDVLTDVAQDTGSSVSDALSEVVETTGLGDVLKSLTGMTLPRLLSLVVLIVVCVVVVKCFLRLVDRILKKGRIERSLHSFIRTTARILGWGLALLIVASSLGVDVTSLIAVLSVAGLAISLAVQDSLSNLASGIQLLAAKPFKVGDYIEASGVSGTVAEITMVHTRLQTIDNKLIYIPNSEMADAKITNYNVQERRRVDLVIGASYDAPTRHVIDTIRGVIDAHPKALQDPEPFVRMTALEASWVNYTLRVWCQTADYWDLYYDLLEQIRDAFEAAGIELTYPHLNVHMDGKKG